MWLFNQPSSSARTALIYITVGAVSVIWTGIWYLYLLNNPPEAHGVYYWCGGFLLTGFTLMLIGFMVGQIGRSARHADNLPQEVSQAMATAIPAALTPAAVTTSPGASGVLVGTDGHAVAPSA
jgi:hypothetical protein